MADAAHMIGCAYARNMSDSEALAWNMAVDRADTDNSNAPRVDPNDSASNVPPPPPPPGPSGKQIPATDTASNDVAGKSSGAKAPKGAIK
jgi:hypothetical protein